MIGHALGPYRVLEQIGAGAMGVVFRARDSRLDREVALKVLPASALGDEDARRRLLQEARTASALNHPNICAIYDVGEADGQVYIAMELVHGRLLTADLGPDPSALPRVLRLGVQLADSLEHAHERGVVHRDLKPSNIMVTPHGDAKILDFGVASRTPAVSADQTRSAATREGAAYTTAGTLSYLAPELLQGGVPDGRADIWALGIVLYELMTGHRPFEGSTSFEVSSAILRDPTPALPVGVPAALGGVVMKCLEKEPARRYQRAGEVRAGLETALSAWSDRATTAPPPAPSTRLGAGAPTPTRATRWGGTRRNAVVAGVCLILLTVAVIALSPWRRLQPGTSSAAVPRVESIAVLPLANLSGDPAQEFFADGMTEALIADLAKISSLKVISRTSVMRYRGTTRPLPEVARELGVDAVIEGSVQRSNERVRITAQLIDASSDRHLWADSYDRSAQDVLALQSEVARAIAAQVRARVTTEEAARLEKARTVKPEAYEVFLLGRYHVAKLNPDSLERALEYFRKATELDPAFALAWAGLSGAYVERDIWAGLGVGRHADAARAAALKAIGLEPDLAEAHDALAAVKFQHDWDWPGTEAAYLKAIELNPSLANAYSGYSYYLIAMGRVDEAVANARRAAELDPLSPRLVGSYGRTLYRARRYEEAIGRYLRALEIDPEDRPSLSRIAEAYIQLGNYQEALTFIDRLEKVGSAPTAKRVRGRIYAAMGRTSEALAEVERIKRDKTVGDQGFAIAAIYSQLRRPDEAIAALEGGVDAHFRREAGAILPFVPADPVFDPLRGHPRFDALLQRAKLPRYPLPVRK
ncbi:MAG: protein kinase domain-containing protein [Vicinamibacterales bacterium]